MCDGDNEFDMPRPFTTNFLLGDLYTTSIADNTLVTDTLVFATSALIVTRGTEDALTEKAVTFGLIGSIIYGFGLGNLTIRIFQYLFGRG